MIRDHIQKTKNNIYNKYLHFSIKRRIALFTLAVVPITSMGAGMSLYIDNAVLQDLEPVVLNDMVIALDERIVVSFAQPIIDIDAYEKQVDCFPAEQLSFEWRDGNRVLHIIPRSIWRPNTIYSVAFPLQAGIEKSEIAQIFQFETASYPEVVSSNTEDAKRIFEDNEEIIINFDGEIEQYDIQAVVRPYITTEQFVDKKGKNLRIKINADNDRDNGGYHNVTVFVKHSSQDDRAFYPIAYTSFSTLMPTPQEWPKEFKERVDIAKKTTIPKIKKGKYIDVNLTAKVTTLFEDGHYVAGFVNSTGAKDTPTPTGSFKIYNKHPYALSGMFGVYLPFWMAFTEDGKYGFHDLVVWPEGHKDMPEGGKESIASIGNAVSPGCVRHDAQSSKKIYDWTDVGTPVVIYE